MTRVFSDDDLVAYLDSELSAADKQAVDSQLATDTELSQRLEQLQESWKLLDHLETVKVTDDFAKSTIAMAAVELDRRGPLDFVRSNWKLIAGSLTALLLGFALVLIPSAIRNRQQLADVTIINNLDLYRRADSVTFLRELNDAGLFDPDLSLDAAFGADDALEEVIPNDPTVGEDRGELQPFADADETKVAIASMTESQIAELQRKRETFESLKHAEQERLRKLYLSLVDDTDRKKLFSVLKRYQQWLKSLSSTQLAEVASLGSQERIELIRDLMSQQERSRFAELELNEDSKMSDKDIDTITSWLRGYLVRHEGEFLQQIPERFRRKLNDRRRRQRLIPVLVSDGKIEAMPPTDEEFAEITESVSKEMSIKLGSLDSDARTSLVRSWLTSRGKSVRPSTVREQQFGRSMRERIDRFMREEVSAEDRQRMNAMSGRDKHNELMRLYFEKHPSREGRPSDPSWHHHPPPPHGDDDDTKRRRE